MKKTIFLLMLCGCTGIPGQHNNTPISSENQPIIIIQDSIVCNSDLSLKPTNSTESAPTQAVTNENGKYNYIFYCFALVVALCLGIFFYKKWR